MNKEFSVIATRTHTYEIKVRATDEQDAYDSLDAWIADDFEPFEIDAKWEFQINPYDSHNQSCVDNGNSVCMFCRAEIKE